MVFDIGRVLINWDPEGFYDRTIGPQARLRLFRDVDLHGANHFVDEGAPWRDTYAALADAHPDHAAEIMLWHDSWIEMTRPRIEETRDIFLALHRNAVPIYALTNFGVEPLRRAQQEYDVLTMFEAMIVSGELGVTKPRPEIYERVEAVTGLSGDALLFTDDSEANVLAARARGWTTHHYREPTGLAAWLTGQGLLPAWRRPER